MKPQSNQPTQDAQPTPSKRPRLDDANRCWHHTPTGRRCRMPICRSGGRLCYEHTAKYKKQDAYDLKEALLFDHEGFQTAQGINFALRNLYGLLANNYISPRRASVLAYISSLLLRTLPQIDADNQAGIKDPFAPEEPDTQQPEAAASSNNEPEENETEDETAGDPDNDDNVAETSAATSPQSASPAAPKTSAQTKRDPHWPDSIPEPDPTKKPS
jgi:hypothetical protein